MVSPNYKPCVLEECLQARPNLCKAQVFFSALCGSLANLRSKAFNRKARKEMPQRAQRKPNQAEPGDRFYSCKLLKAKDCEL
jgi:hypothetical protein